MEREELKTLNNIEIYKAYNSDNNFTGYIFSIEDSDFPEELGYRYYFVSVDQNNVPTISRVNNTINLLNSEELVLSQISPDSEEVIDFLRLVTTLEKPPKKERFSHHQKSQPRNFLHSINENDLRLLKRS